ncbi:MAG: Uncharacterised protein [Prochlorococcus marinus str. MIT 9215]|nr:MAG: Uncharacterised protein [Prochlorococcus marinus str. MIT 9215]
MPEKDQGIPGAFVIQGCFQIRQAGITATPNMELDVTAFLQQLELFQFFG